MKKILIPAMAFAMIFSMAACGNTNNNGVTSNTDSNETVVTADENTPETITIQSFNANKELVKVIEIPADKKRMFGVNLQELIAQMLNDEGSDQ